MEYSYNKANTKIKLKNLISNIMPTSNNHEKKVEFLEESKNKNKEDKILSIRIPEDSTKIYFTLNGNDITIISKNNSNIPANIQKNMLLNHLNNSYLLTIEKFGSITKFEKVLKTNHRIEIEDTIKALSLLDEIGVELFPNIDYFIDALKLANNINKIDNLKQLKEELLNINSKNVTKKYIKL